MRNNTYRRLIVLSLQSLSASTFFVHKMCVLMSRLWIGVLLLLWSACNEPDNMERVQQTDDFAECLYERPEPIFSSYLPEVSDHDFDVVSKVGIEKVTFASGLMLDIHQSGCDELQQNFYFDIGERLSPEYAIVQASEYFHFLGGLDEAYLPLYEWGRLINQNAHHIELNRAFEIYPGFWVTIRQYKKKQTVLLEVVLSQVG